MKLIEARTKREIITEELEERFVNIRKSRAQKIVKPALYRISAIDPNGVMNGIFAETNPIAEEQTNLLNGQIFWSRIKYAEGETAGYDGIFRSVIPKARELFHQTSLLYNSHGTNMDRIDLIANNNLIGDSKFVIKRGLGGVTGRPTYIKEAGVDSRNFLGGANECLTENGTKVIAYWNFCIDVEKLRETRNVFFDYESIGDKYEFGKTYLVFGGIPLNAITSGKIIVFDPNNI